MVMQKNRLECIIIDLGVSLILLLIIFAIIIFYLDFLGIGWEKFSLFNNKVLLFSVSFDTIFFILIFSKKVKF